MDTVRTLGNAAGMTAGEGNVTKMIESQTARIPSGTYLSLAIRHPHAAGQAQCRKFRRAVGADDLDHGPVQQARETRGQ